MNNHIALGSAHSDVLRSTQYSAPYLHLPYAIVMHMQDLRVTPITRFNHRFIHFSFQRRRT